MTVQKVLSLIALGALLVGCEASDQTVTPSPEVSAPSPTASEKPSIKPACERDLPVEPTYLPEGFRHEVFDGAFPAGRPPDDLASSGIGKPHEEQVIVHYRGSGGRAIEIRRPGTLFSELAQADDAPTIEVLGTDTPAFAPISPGGNEFIVAFPYPPGAGPHQWCSWYSLNEYRVSLAELKKVAESLRVRSADKPFRLLIHCGLSYPLEFEGRNWLPVDTRLRRTHNPPEGFGDDENYDMGAIRRIDDDTIIYTSSDGVEVEYEPTDKRAEGCE